MCSSVYLTLGESTSSSYFSMAIVFGREVIERFDQKVSKTFLFFEEIEFLSGVVLEDKRRSFFESESSREKMPDIYTLSSMLLESNVDDGVEVVAAKSQWQQKQETSKQGRFSLR